MMSVFRLLLARACLLLLTGGLAMPLWAEPSATARADCERLLNAVLPMAVELLRKHGEFFPYGGALGRDGEIVTLAGADARERPPAEDLVAALRRGFVLGAQSGDYIATALVQDVSAVVPDTRMGSDAIAVALDHRDAYSVVVVMPYELHGQDIRWGETYTLDGEGGIFPGNTPGALESMRRVPLDTLNPSGHRAFPSGPLSRRLAAAP